LISSGFASKPLVSFFHRQVSSFSSSESMLNISLS
jgi:hypothetical protein